MNNSNNIIATKQDPLASRRDSPIYPQFGLGQIMLPLANILPLLLLLMLLIRAIIVAFFN